MTTIKKKKKYDFAIYHKEKIKRSKPRSYNNILNTFLTS